ncbi:MAG: hypothetical protein DWP94_05675, partial [Flavobacterium sp.]
TQYRVPTNIINSKFYITVAARSGNSAEQTKELFVYMERIGNAPSIGKQELKELHYKIESFKHKADGKP